ncbi:MAG TPA: wax ester/triacylglycerol synthase domain-containing protein, partial [Pilimelia sp.]|nr:wax ester/triacylglycerol synthase domain-containing protein [Pilimelia sp.]
MERLTAQDLSTLWPDDVGWPQDIGAVAILAAEGPFGADGRLDIEAVREAIRARLHLVPRFRQRLLQPRRGLGWPLWVDAEDFDIADHVDIADNVDGVPVAAPAGEAELLPGVDELRRRPLDRSRPLWRMWFLPWFPDGRAAFYLRVHHAIADGAAGVATLEAFLETVPDPPAVAVPPFAPAPVPSGGALLADNVRRHAGEVSRAASALVRPVRTLRRLRAGWPAVHETLASER